MSHRLIYLVRHGQVQASEGERYIGQLDLPLSTDGVLQAGRLAQALQSVHLSAVWCSDLQRSLRTAEIIAGHRVRPQPRSDLREISLGQWEGLTFEQVRRQHPSEFAARGLDLVGYRPPGGESFADLSQRVIPAFTQIATGGAGDLLIVGHAGVNRIILCQILGMPLQNLFRLAQDYGCLNLIFHDESGDCLQILGMVY